MMCMDITLANVTAFDANASASCIMIADLTHAVMLFTWHEYDQHYHGSVT